MKLILIITLAAMSIGLADRLEQEQQRFINMLKNMTGDFPDLKNGREQWPSLVR